MATINFNVNGSTQSVPVLRNNMIDGVHMPKRTWESRAPVPGTWYTNTTDYEMDVYAQLAYGPSSNSVVIEMRESASSPTVWFQGDFNNTTTSKNFSVKTTIPARWQYRVTVGSGQTLSRFYEFACRT